MGSPCATSDLGLYLLPVILVWIYIAYSSEEDHTYWVTEHATHVELCISRDSTLGMTFFYPLRIYHHPEMITLDGIGISRESTSAIQHVVILGHLDTKQLGSTDR
ncbi:hypothetical protein M9H77_11827 [Catharanthus roseus]|uniref:Uncharacterized protein n=1 Tax=Catharanthus roseus TaxID=4058 RepID=A0ACC0BFR9_CATRO|nr:hypothetical protein M9H77_11827 [Catharanthus roseus]